MKGIQPFARRKLHLSHLAPAAKNSTVNFTLFFRNTGACKPVRNTCRLLSRARAALIL